MTDVHSRIAALSPEQQARLETQLAELATARGTSRPERIPPRDRSWPAPLATAQQREWAVERIRAANNITGVFRVEGALDPDLLSRVLTELVNRHEILRSTVEILPSGAPAQVVHAIEAVPVPVVDLAELTTDQQQKEILRRGRADLWRRFDPTDPLRLRLTLLRLAAETHVALFCNDHAAADAWSMAIILHEMAAGYDRHRNGGPGLPPPEIQYADFAAWQHAQYGEQRIAAEVQHWTDTLAGIRGLALPADRPYPARPTFAGDLITLDLSPELSTATAQFCSREKASLVMVVLAACSVLMHRMREQHDLVIGTLVSGRTRTETEQLVGCFTNPIPLRMSVHDDQTLHDVVRQAREVVATALEHQDVPFDRLVEALGLGREASQTSLSGLWINVVTVPDMTFEFPGLRMSQEPVDLGQVSVDLTLTVAPQPDGLRLHWHYMTEVFDSATVQLIAEGFRNVLGQIVAEPGRTVAEVRFDGSPEPIPAAPADSDRSFVEAFERRVALTPDAPAVIGDGRTISFAKLDAEAELLARRLRAHGVAAEVSVGILVDRSPRFAVAILAVLKARGAFVPIDPSYPADRVAFLLRDSRSRALLTEQRLLGVLTESGAELPEQVVVLDRAAAPSDVAPTREPAPPDPSSLAYVIYTSGSTGRPKGVMIENRSLVRFAREIVDRLGLGPEDRFLQFASLGFDVLVEELFPTWLAGGAIVISTSHIVSGQIALADVIERDRLTVIELPTAYWHEWVRDLDRTGRELPSCLRLLIIGGDRVLPDRLAMWRRLDVPLMHVYGLTETTVSSTFFRLDPTDPGYDSMNLPIGTPLPSADLRVLDSRLTPVPPGGTGELYLGGISLARGYCGRPGLTAERFVADPHAARPSERLYRTGDLVRRRADGNLEFVSRVDAQVKIRGFRVEPAEVESALGGHPQIAESIVTVHEPAPGDRRLVAYLVPGPGGLTGTAELRRFLERTLPSHLVPSAFIQLEALPLGPNGKVARNRLPSPDDAPRAEPDGYVAPGTPEQQTLAEIIAAVVGIARIGIHDNFFEVGGDSILAIQVVALAQQSGMRLTPYDLFASPTVAALAELVTTGGAVDAEQGDVVGPVTLTSMQQWFCTLGLAEPQHWNRSVLLELTERAAPETLSAAVERVLAHHDGLRQRFLLASERSRARIAPRGDEMPFEMHDLSGLDPAERTRRLHQAGARMQESLDPAVGPLIRVALFRFGDAPDRLAVVAHRLVADPTSMRIVLQDLETAMVQLSAGEELRFLPKTTSWQSWCRRLARYAASEQVASQRAFWSDLVATPAGHLPTDGTDTDGPHLEATTRTVSSALDPRETESMMQTVPRRLGCTVEELLLAALGQVLTGWCGAERQLVAVERHDREPLFDDVDLSRTVGWFSRTHPLVLASSPDGSFEKTLRGVQRSLRDVPAAGIGWPLLRQGPDSLPEPPIEVGFCYLGQLVESATRSFSLVDTAVGQDRSPRGRRPYALEVEASVVAGTLRLHWRYGERRHRQETVVGLAERCLQLLRGLIEPCPDDRGSVAPAPADFPLARVDGEQLSQLLNRLRTE